MNVAILITVSRILLAPVFLLLLLTGDGASGDNIALIVGLWVVYGTIELSDLADGLVARRMGQVTDLGKILDPFADSLSRLTAFLGFTLIGLMPVWVFVVIFYRDMGVSFMRTLLARKGVAQGARLSGKLKAWAYALANISGLAAFTTGKVLIFFPYHDIFQFLCSICFYVAAAVALLSGLDYARAFFTGQLAGGSVKNRKTEKKQKKR